jgi:hypothetical protein
MGHDRSVQRNVEKTNTCPESYLAFDSVLSFRLNLFKNLQRDMHFKVTRIRMHNTSYIRLKNYASYW